MGTPLSFTGVSAFSQDFQTILKRALDIAAIPIKSMQNDQLKLVTQKQLLSTISGAVGDLEQTLESLGQVAATKGLTASSSNTAKVTVTNASATSAASYTLSEIASVARSASASSAGYTDGSTTAVSATGSVKLTVGGVAYPAITLGVGQNNLAGMRDEINALGAGVTATVLTTGTGATPYYLSITSNSTGERAITLVDDPDGAATNLLAVTDDGANASFKINGVPVSKSSNLINDVIPGLVFTVLGTTSGSETVALTLASDRSKLSSALKSLVTAYNAAVDQVDAQTGPNAGLLSGDLIVREVQARLRQISSYSSGGAINSLSDLGIEFGKDGKASFNQTIFDALSSSDVDAAFTFVGSQTTGFGGLSTTLKQISDPITGLIKIEQDGFDKTDHTLADHIAAVTVRVAALQASLSAKLQAADAILNGLESQRVVLEATIKGLNLTLYGRSEG